VTAKKLFVFIGFDPPRRSSRCWPLYCESVSSLQQRRLCAANVGTLQQFKAGLSGIAQFRFELLVSYVPSRLNQQQSGATFAGCRSFCEERAG